jgi:hypothetical protein
MGTDEPGGVERRAKSGKHPVTGNKSKTPRSVMAGNCQEMP